MSLPRRLLLLVSIAAATMGLQTSAEAFSALFSWAGIPSCQSVSPAFTLHEVPPGTKQLKFIMHDAQVPSFRHGGSTVPYSGNDAVPKGAIHYIGPCPPKGDRHLYRWDIEALDRSGKILGQTTAGAPFPP
jgi:phosphatidylethanolamine-binding protein (PEBP) family uncharacterized protein